MMSQEAALIRNYLDTILELPWNNLTLESKNIQASKDQLDKDHFGLEKVKSRILEFLAVKFLKGNSKGNIICLVGAPGVGKTSLGRSIAKALGRKFERVSLGGVKDSAEIRGHRRTYVGSFPGCIIQAIRRANSKNPVILLDEIDKLDRDHRGDPSSALLEALDPEQNSTFTDHFLNVEFDLSNVMFIATANQLDPISQPLLDRMEVIELDGYQQNEKLQIALKYILPKQLDESGITQDQLYFDEESLKFLIDGYTQELGVRNLERKVAQICRAVAFKYTISKQDQQHENFIQIKTTKEMIQDILGTKYNFKEDLEQRLNVPGVVVGMAYTQFGGKILIIEVSHCKGKGNIIITGQVKQVMQESVQTALGWIKSNLNFFKEYYNLKINDEDSNTFNFNNFDINVHFPAAAIPKDGPSAGVAITVALVSLLLQRNVRSDVAMTGEVSLKGKVLPIGGVKEKCIAAFENGIKNIILPEQNRQDIEKLPVDIKSKINFVIVKRVEEAIEFSLGFKQTGILKLSKL